MRPIKIRLKIIVGHWQSTGCWTMRRSMKSIDAVRQLMHNSSESVIDSGSRPLTDRISSFQKNEKCTIMGRIMAHYATYGNCGNNNNLDMCNWLTEAPKTNAMRNNNFNVTRMAMHAKVHAHTRAPEPNVLCRHIASLDSNMNKRLNN